MNTWSFYKNEFKTGVKSKALFKSFEYKYVFRGLIIFDISITYRNNLRTSNDYREYELGNKKIKYTFDSLYLTLFSNKYYLLYISWSYFYKTIKFLHSIYNKKRRI